LLENEQNGGLASFLSGEASHISNIIIKSPIANCDVLARGKQSTNKFEALSSDIFCKVMLDLRTRYDRIIIDTPPLLGLADALMISGSVDGVLLVIRADQTTQRDIRSALEVVEGTHRPLYGFVLNGVDLTKLENYYYYSSYYPKYYDPSYVLDSAA
jgi:capsular exopolysaccharide synthesis family protein